MMVDTAGYSENGLTVHATMHRHGTVVVTVGELLSEHSSVYNRCQHFMRNQRCV